MIRLSGRDDTIDREAKRVYRHKLGWETVWVWLDVLLSTLVFLENR